jgi:hypothetical protein
MDWICEPVWATHLRSAFAISSGPLSRRLCSGLACRHITSARASIATKLLMRRAIFNAGQARLCSDLCLALAGAGLVGLGRRGAGRAEGRQRWVSALSAGRSALPGGADDARDPGTWPAS